ncbi:hypothetical protein R3P38DRAFT_3211782 [Favolaschia claudopus]|uniref:Uncharacterized protein n=1 Tax=Favolaschia claudopus TaxID=2862362 RepID=A0AAW0AGC2_9AGAR
MDTAASTSQPSLHEFEAMRDTIARVLYSGTVEQCLSRMDWEQLYRTALHSQMGAQNVRIFVAVAIDSVLSVERYKDSTRALVVNHVSNPRRQDDRESRLAVLGALLRSDFGRLSGDDRSLCSILLQGRISDILADFGLSYGDIKVMQAATGTLISGSVIPAIIRVAVPFELGDVDFYCGNGNGLNVVRYLTFVGDLSEEADITPNYSDLFGLRRVWTLQSPQGRSINVIETQSDSPLDAILNFHSTPPRGAISWDRFSHYDINRARNGIALVTPSTMHINTTDLARQKRIWEVIHKYTKRGFTFVFDYEPSHECGRHIECPATRRTTVDEGCLHIALPAVPIPHFREHNDFITTWTLTTAGVCRNGVINGQPVHHNLDFREDYGLSRDRTMKSKVDRYSFKDKRGNNYRDREEWAWRLLRMPMARYNGSLIGTISGYIWTYHANPLFRETQAGHYQCATIRCPVGTDQATVELYNRQVGVLKKLIQDDLATEVVLSFLAPGIVEKSWVRQDENGADLIEIMSFRYIEFIIGGDVDVHVSLSKDQYRDSTGTLVKSYNLWLQEHQVLTDKDMGRV